MDEKSLYAAVLGVTSPWGVEKVDLRLTEGEIGSSPESVHGSVVWNGDFPVD